MKPMVEWPGTRADLRADNQARYLHGRKPQISM